MTHKLFVLHHTYINNLEEETKFLGAYSSETKVKEAINRYMSLPGFNKHSIKCFITGECNLDEDANWIDGF